MPPRALRNRGQFIRRLKPTRTNVLRALRTGRSLHFSCQGPILPVSKGEGYRCCNRNSPLVRRRTATSSVGWSTSTPKRSSPVTPTTPLRVRGRHVPFAVNAVYHALREPTRQGTRLNIDIFPHILPKLYFDQVQASGTAGMLMAKRIQAVTALHDLDTRLRIMDEYENYTQVLTLGAPPIENIAGPDVTPDLAKLANEEMAKLCQQRPDTFLGFVASLPLNNPDASIVELERAIDELGAVGVQLNTNVSGKPLDLPDFDYGFSRSLSSERRGMDGDYRA